MENQVSKVFLARAAATTFPKANTHQDWHPHQDGNSTVSTP